MRKKRLTLSIIACSFILYAAPVDTNNSSLPKNAQASLNQENNSIDLGDVEVSETKIKKKVKKSIKKRVKKRDFKPSRKITKKRVKSYSPIENIKKETTPKTTLNSSNAKINTNSSSTLEEESSTTQNTFMLENLAKVEIKNADVAEAIAKNIPSVALVRRSGIANDLIVRGLKKDNISISIDGSKIYGACPNRMDPPLSHVLANNIDYIEIIEGNDVTEQGAMGAAIKVHTLEPTKEFTGDINFGVGIWKYSKLSTYLSGGIGDFRFAVGLSTETSREYEDGDGNDFSKQQENYILTHPTAKGMAYKPNLKEMKAYTKSTMMGKVFWDITLQIIKL